jgi:tetratricopeptide (TPR) repeat protein
VLRMRQGRYGEALPQCQRSLAIHGSNPRAWVNLASVYVNEKRWQLALEASLKAVEVKPFFPEARYLVAVSYANLGDLDRAREHLAVGLAEDPTHTGLIDLKAQMARRGK